MATQIRRRYKDTRLPEYRLYSDFFDKALRDSRVFNRDGFSGITTIFWDKTAIQTEMKILQEASVPELRKQLQACESRFESYCQQREAAGYDRPEAWPQHLLRDRCKVEARLDVTLREVEFLKSKLEELYLKPEQRRVENEMLAYGPVGTGRLQDGTLVEIDGQECQMIDGVLIITSEGSPYRGMRVRDYRQYIVGPYAEARSRRLRELNEKRKMEIAQGFTKTALLLGPRKIDKSSLPPWPEGVRNYLKPEEEPKAETENENL